MTDILARYGRALDAFDAVITRVKPDQWQNPSPCPEWAAVDVAGHVVGGQWMLHAFATGTQPANPSIDPGRFAGTDPAESWRQARNACLAALTPEALDRSINTFAFGESTVGAFTASFGFDLLAHTWDLAQATGQQLTLPPDLLEGHLAWGRTNEAALRAPGMLGPAVPVPGGADLQTRFIAFLGRTESR